MYSSLQFGRKALPRFCGTSDLPAPLLQTRYRIKVWYPVQWQKTMEEVAQRLVEITMDRTSPDDIHVETTELLVMLLSLLMVHGETCFLLQF